MLKIPLALSACIFLFGCTPVVSPPKIVKTPPKINAINVTLKRNPFYPVVEPSGTEYFSNKKLELLNYVGFVNGGHESLKKLALIAFADEQAIIKQGDLVAQALVIDFNSQYLLVRTNDGTLFSKTLGNKVVQN